MKRSYALFALVVVLVICLVPAIALAAETVAEDVFDPDSLVLGGVALAPLISVLISVLKGWVKIESKYLPLINVVLGGLAVLVVAVVNNGMSIASAIIMTLGVVLGSHAFHESFGHAGKVIQELFGKKPQPEE